MNQNMKDYQNFKHKCISFATPEDEAEIRSLWKEIFQDSDAFIDFYFKQVFDPEKTLVIKRDNRIASMLQLLREEFVLDHRLAKSAFYIYGACTRPSEQGKGYMHLLIEEAIAIAQSYYSLLFTIPAEPSLFDFYKQAGLTHPINYLAKTYQVNKSPVKNTNYTFVQCQPHDKHASFYMKIQRRRKGGIFHSDGTYNNLLSELAIEGGGAYVALENEQPVGIAFAQPETNNKVIIKDLLYQDRQVRNALIRAIAAIYQAETIEVRQPVSLENNSLTDENNPQLIREEVVPYGLACSSDPATFLDLPDLYITLMYD